MKKTTDQIIDQTLTGLRHTQPRDGMEQRIVNALQSQPTPRLTCLIWTWPLATAALAAILLAAPFVMFHHHPTRSKMASTTPSIFSSSPTKLSSRPEPQRSEGAVERPASPARASTNAHSTRTQQPPQTPREQLTPGDALAEMRAPSQPAPELPLTDQEKLMLRILHRGDPIQLAQLDPAHRAAERAADRQQFHDFFTKPITGDNQ